MPPSRLPGTPILKEEELTIRVNEKEYPLSQVSSYCNNCKTLLPIPEKWLRYWQCTSHPGNQSILSRKRRIEIDLNVPKGEMKDVEKIEGICRKKSRTGITCDNYFDLTADFSHRICRKCYEERKRKNEPRYKIPFRADHKDGFFYDVRRDKIYARQ